MRIACLRSDDVAKHVDIPPKFNFEGIVSGL